MDFLPLLAGQVYSVPFYILWLGGILYALVNRDKHPRTSLFAAIGLAILLVESLASGILTAFVQYESLTRHAPMTAMATRLTTLSLCTIPVSMVGWLLLLLAIFGSKNVAERETINGHSG